MSFPKIGKFWVSQQVVADLFGSDCWCWWAKLEVKISQNNICLKAKIGKPGNEQNILFKAKNGNSAVKRLPFSDLL